jgi:cytosine/adenosine deaminase-related metal-dependent hydrolase
MNEWIQTLMRVRRAGPAGGRDEEVTAMRRAAAAMQSAGTVLVGDVSNTLGSPRALAAAGLGGRVFYELLGFNHADPAGAVRDAWERIEHEKRLESGEPPIACSVTAHAPYSVSPGLFTEIVARAGTHPLSIHLAESPEEVEFLKTGGGPIRGVLEGVGAWVEGWEPPGSDPVQYLADLGYLRRGTLVVHGVHLTEDGLARLRRAGAVIVACPRSNLWVGAGSPRLARFFAAGLPVAIGTDSLASVHTLSTFDELAEMRRLAPEVAAATLLDSATRVGATALGFGRDYGTIRPGKRAALVSVIVPAAEADVEEYLVSGVPTSAVTPLSI